MEENICKLSIPDKGLTFKIYKKHTTNSKTNNNSILKWTKDLNKHFPKKDELNGQQVCEKRCLTLQVIGKIQIKSMMRYHITPVRIAIVKKTRDNKC